MDERIVSGDAEFWTRARRHLQCRALAAVLAHPGRSIVRGAAARRDSRAIVDETGWGARFSQLAADGIVGEKLPAATLQGQRGPTAEMPAT